MKDKISPLVAIVAVIIVVVVVAVIGYKVLGPQSAGDNVAEYRKKYAPNAPPGPLVQHMPPGGPTASHSAPPGAPPGWKPPGQ
jgi:hypothetical protein